MPRQNEPHELELRVPQGSAPTTKDAAGDDASRNHARIEELNAVIEQSARVPSSSLRNRIGE